MVKNKPLFYKTIDFQSLNTKHHYLKAKKSPSKLFVFSTLFSVMKNVRVLSLFSVCFVFILLVFVFVSLG